RSLNMAVLLRPSMMSRNPTQLPLPGWGVLARRVFWSGRNSSPPTHLKIPSRGGRLAYEKGGGPAVPQEVVGAYGPNAPTLVSRSESDGQRKVVIWIDWTVRLFGVFSWAGFTPLLSVSSPSLKLNAFQETVCSM